MKKSLVSELNNRRKAAIMLTILGPEIASNVIKFLDEAQVEILTLELARLERVSLEQREVVVREFHEMATAQDYISEGGIEQARKLLEEAYGTDKAAEMLKKIVTAMQIVPFEFLKRIDPTQLVGFVKDEHPQTIALIISYMGAEQGAGILKMLPEDIRAEVAERIAIMDQTPPEVIRKIEQILERKVSSLVTQEMTVTGGPRALVDLLNKVDRGTERVILDSLIASNPELANDIKNMMFVFEDIIQLDDRAIQAVLKEIDVKDLGTALKTAKSEVADKIYKNMSERAKGMLQEDMEYMGPVKLRVVEEAQQKIVSVIRKLEESGEITISRGEEDILV